MRNQDFLANPKRVAQGSNSNGFRAVTAAGDVTENPMPRQHASYGPNVNGDDWKQFSDDVDATPRQRGPSKRLGKGR